MNKLGKFVTNLFYPKFESDKKIKSTQKKAIIFLVVGLVIIIGGFILTECIDNPILELAFIPIMIVSLIFALFGLIRLIQVKNEVFRLKRITCSKCKTRFQYPNDVKYSLGGTNSATSSKNGQLKKRTSQWVDFECTCHNCGEKKSFSRNTLIKEETLNGYGAVLSSYSYDIETEVADFFREEQNN